MAKATIIGTLLESQEAGGVERDPGAAFTSYSDSGSGAESGAIALFNLGSPTSEADLNRRLNEAAKILVRGAIRAAMAAKLGGE
ncbi:MAG TPA: hypothetical protein VGM51_01600 [Armatimonadota bacterium]|jgi:hypothetical protein